MQGLRPLHRGMQTRLSRLGIANQSRGLFARTNRRARLVHRLQIVPLYVPRTAMYHFYRDKCPKRFFATKWRQKCQRWRRQCPKRRFDTKIGKTRSKWRQKCPKWRQKCPKRRFDTKIDRSRSKRFFAQKWRRQCPKWHSSDATRLYEGQRCDRRRSTSGRMPSVFWVSDNAGKRDCSRCDAII